MKIETLARLGLLFCFVAPYTASAGMIPPPFACSQTGETASVEFGVIHDLGSTTRYRVQHDVYGNTGFDVKRRTTSAYLGYGDLFLAAGMIHRTEITADQTYDFPVPLTAESGYVYPPAQEDSIDGDGFLIAVGARSTIWEKNSLSLVAYGQLAYSRESCRSTTTYIWYDQPVYIQAQPEIYPPIYPTPEPRTGTVDTRLDIDSTELFVGFLGRYTGHRYAFYAGIELTPYSDIQENVSVRQSDVSRQDAKYNIERDDSVSLLLGWQALFRNYYLTVESRAMGEKSLRVGVGLGF